SLHDLENMLEVAVENENYEEAAKLRDEIIKLKNQQGA
ncbi:MAG TPA: UvrB/UvrC motif-containing protein, partial [Spirochaetota bacterium]|nr:UvrB/UvrC motif-containing protein [Spirochaetota bacterium]